MKSPNIYTANFNNQKLMHTIILKLWDASPVNSLVILRSQNVKVDAQLSISVWRREYLFYLFQCEVKAIVY